MKKRVAGGRSGRRAAVAALGLAAGLGGCSFFVPVEQTVTIRTIPSGVPVRVDGEAKGPSPVTLELRRDSSHLVVATTQGALYTRELARRMSPTGALDMIGGSILLVPGLGLLAPGAWSLDETDVTLRMDSVAREASMGTLATTIVTSPHPTTRPTPP